MGYHSNYTTKKAKIRYQIKSYSKFIKFINKIRKGIKKIKEYNGGTNQGFKLTGCSAEVLKESRKFRSMQRKVRITDVFIRFGQR